MRKLFALIILILYVSVAHAQTPPLFATNAKYLGWAGTGGGTANAQTVTYSPALTSLTAGQAVSWIPSHANTSAATLNVNGIGATSIVKANGSALVANDLLTTAVATAVYDGTYFELLDPQSGSGANVMCGQLPALTGDTTTSAGSCATTTSKLNGTSFAGTSTHLVAFGAANIPVDSGIPDTAAGILAACTGCAPLNSAALVTPTIDGTTSATLRTRDFGTSFGDTGASALTSGSVVYFTVPYACTIAAWNITVDAGTVTFDIWKAATGTAIPTVSNTITASAKPALSTGTAIHSTSMTGWTTTVAANDIFGIQLNTVATAKYAEIDLQCTQ